MGMETGLKLLGQYGDGENIHGMAGEREKNPSDGLRTGITLYSLHSVLLAVQQNIVSQ